MVSKALLTAFRHLVQNTNFVFASTYSMNLLIVKMLTETILRSPLIVIGRCSPALTPHWLQGKSAKIYLSQAAFGMILQDHRQLSVSTIPGTKSPL
jgi:hypothetical protein